MGKAKTLNFLTEEPTKKTELTKDFMLTYIKIKGTEEDKKWFKARVKEHTIEKENRFKAGETVKGLDLKPLRNEFADRFFPNLNKTKDFFAEVDEL